MGFESGNPHVWFELPGHVSGPFWMVAALTVVLRSVTMVERWKVKVSWG